MNQSRLRSFIEASTNSISGMVTGFLANLYILPHLIGAPVDQEQATIVMITFTFISIARSYIVRRVFNFWR